MFTVDVNQQHSNNNNKILKFEGKKNSTLGLSEPKKLNHLIFLAHLCPRLRVRYCHWPMSVVRRPSCIVRRQQFAVNDIFSETARPRALIFGM